MDLPNEFTTNSKAVKGTDHHLKVKRKYKDVLSRFDDQDITVAPNGRTQLYQEHSAFID